MEMIIYLEGWDAADEGISKNPYQNDYADFWQKGFDDYFSTLENDPKN